MIEVRTEIVRMDNRGHGVYNLFDDILDGQCNITTTAPGVVRAFHYHEKQIDHWFCVKGNLHVILIEPLSGYEFRDFVEYSLLDGGFSAGILVNGNWRQIGRVYHRYIGEQNPVTLKIPPGVLHGFTPMHGKEATLLYYTDQKYDANDEKRISWRFLGEDIWSVSNK